MNSDAGTERLWVRIEGRVQGVGFRYFVRQKARELRLTGWVRNRFDGSVEVVAEGAPQILERLLDDLHRGPPASSVTKVSSNWTVANSEFLTFLMKSTG
jgi:acylphosphatase